MSEQLDTGYPLSDILQDIRENLPSTSSGWELTVDPYIISDLKQYYHYESMGTKFLCEQAEERKESLLLKAGTVFRILCLRAEMDIAETTDSYFMTEALSLLASIVLSDSVGWGLGCMLHLEQEHWKLAESALGIYPKNDLALEVLLYFYSLQIAREIGQWGKARFLKPKDLITFVRRNFGRFEMTESVARFERWIKVLGQYRRAGMLNELSPDIDVERFANEEHYRQDTILGAAMTTDEEMYKMALKLAEEYGISDWDIQMANLEFLLTDPNVDSVTVQSIVKQHKLVSSLSREPTKLLAHLQENVFPLLNGRDHNRLLYYFLIMEKGCEKLAQAEQAQVHRSVLRHLMKLLPDIDYPELITLDTDLAEILWPHLKGSNYLAIGKVLQKIPNKEISSDCVSGIYAAKLFLESVAEIGAKNSWRSCEKIFVNLSSCGFHIFAEIVLWKFDTLKSLPSEWKTTAHLCLVFVESNSERLCSCLELVKNWGKEISDKVDAMAADEISKKEFTKEEEAASGVLGHLKEGDFSGAGRAAANLFGLHSSLATHSNALELAKKIKEKHQ